MLAATLCLLLSPQGANAPVVINEFQYDDSGVDDREFVELYNATANAIDISGWVLQGLDGATVDDNPDFTIPANTVLLPGGFWVMGSSLVPNVNQVLLHPVSGLDVDLFENGGDLGFLGGDGFVLRDAGGVIVDTVIYETNKGRWPGVPIEGEGIWGNLVSTDGTETTWSRVRDGHDSGNNGRDFRMMPHTPGATNNVASILPLVDTFDTAAVGTAIAQWGASFANGYVIDPTVPDINNPNAISASPQGGNAAIFWDRIGGGNHNMLKTAAVRDCVFEAYVYFDATLAPSGERQVWTLGLQGTSGSFFNFPDPSGTAGFTANGDTGVCLTYEVTDFARTLYLVDRNDGGQGPAAITNLTVLGQVAIQPGVNDGWQRVRLQASNCLAEAFFGGNFGRLDGTRLAGPIRGSINGIYISYREGLTNNSTSRPFTADLMVITTSGSNTECFGAAAPSTVGTPRIGSNGFPILGQAGFAITLSGMVPSGAAGMFLGFARQNPPLNLNVLLGAQPGARLYVTTEISAIVGIDGAGRGALPIAVPANLALNGARLDCQAFELDANLPFTLPIAHTEALELTLGN